MPSPLSTKETPFGRAPDSDRGSVGLPVEMTVKVPAEPAVNVVAAADVIAGADVTLRVKAWLALGLIPLLAVMVIG